MLVLEAEKLNSILLLKVLSILSFEANFLDRLSIILPWFWTKSLKGENCWKIYFLDSYLNSYLGSWSSAESILDSAGDILVVVVDVVHVLLQLRVLTP
jgi:hypothetical protein